MTELEEGDRTFLFPDYCEASKYDEWVFYRQQFQSMAGGSKAVDLLCIEDGATWLIEVKDYRRHPRTKAIDLCDEVARKVRDTLAGLAAASANATSVGERETARRALATQRWRVVLHLEQPDVHSRLRPRAFDVANVLSKLREKVRLKAVDANPLVAERDSAQPTVPWTVR